MLVLHWVFTNTFSVGGGTEMRTLVHDRSLAVDLATAPSGPVDVEQV